MKEFINSIETTFNDTCINVLERAIAMTLSPVDTADILYFHSLYLKKESSRDKIMFNMANLSLQKLTNLMTGIKKEFLFYIDKK